MSASPRPGADRWRFPLLVALAAAGPLSHDTYLPALPEIAGDLHVSTSTAQLTLTASLAGLAVGQLFAGPMSDRLGRRIPMIVGPAVFALSALVCALTSSVPLLIAARFVMGFSGAAGVAVSRAVLRDEYSGEAMARQLSVLLAVVSVAPVIAPIAGSAILTFSTWRGIFVAIAIVGATIAVLTALRLPETLPPQRRHPGGLHAVRVAFPRLVRDRRFVGYSLLGALSFGTMFAYIAGSPFVVQDIYGASHLEFALMFAVNAAGIALVGTTAGRLLGRFDMHQLALAGSVQCFVGAVIVLVSWLADGGVWPMLVGFFVMVTAVTTVLQNGMALALEPHASIAGSASAVTGVIQFAIGAAVSPLVGVAGEDTALPLGIIVVALATTCLVLSLGLSRAHQRRLPIDEPIPST